MYQRQATQRHCMNKDHKEQPIVMRCTYQECNNQQKWMCLVCINLHDDHIKHCLRIEEFAKLLKVDDNEKQLFKHRNQLQSVILSELSRQKETLIQCFQSIEQSYLDYFAQLQQEENTIQALYARIQTQNPLALTEKELADFYKLQNTQETSILFESQAQVFSDIQTFNSNLDSITYSLQRFVLQNNGIVTESLFKNNNNFQIVGQNRWGLQFGQWKIINANGETIGGGQYDQSGSKQEQWVDIEQGSVYGLTYVQHIGKYRDGRRIGHWDFKNPKGKILQIEHLSSGGGTYSQSGNKCGQWIDIELTQKYGLPYVSHVGKYQEGNRMDQWVIRNPEEVTIGGGQYNLGKKQGVWTDIELGSVYGHKYLQHIGKYQDNVKFDQWEIKDPQGRIIGGGSYNASGNKNGKWIDVELDAKNGFDYVQHFGKYNNGKRNEVWEVKDPLGKKIDEINYNLNGIIVKPRK